MFFIFCECLNCFYGLGIDDLCRSARLHSASSLPPPLSFIESFCANFDPEQARYAPERGIFYVYDL